MNTVPQLPLDAAREPREQESVHLALTISEPDLVTELLSHPEGRRREEFARAALRIGILAFKTAQGRIDSDAVRAEGDRLVGTLEKALESHRSSTTDKLANLLQEYFHPESGRFNERVRRLLDKDGELERVLRGQVGKDDSELARALAAHVGKDSPLMRMLAPGEAGGLRAQLATAMEQALGTQSTQILAEFSLDKKDSALTRLVSELTTRHGKLGEDLAGRIDVVVKEFSLDNHEGALSRLVGRVEQAQRKISSEFSLDEEGSALARMKRELSLVLQTQGEAAQRFQDEVKTALAGMAARKAESQRSTTHGQDFQVALRSRLQEECQGSGDVLQDVGNTTGLIKNCKVGDFVVTLGQDSRAAGARIVIEAKEDAGYDLPRVLAEMETAQKNRGCGVGLFAWSRASAPAGHAPFARHGDVIVVAWDAEDVAWDVFLHAGLSVARALCTRAAVARERQSADFTVMERAVREVERQSKSLDEIRKAAETIQGGTTTILNRVRIAQEQLGKQVASLDDVLADLRPTSDADPPA